MLEGAGMVKKVWLYRSDSVYFELYDGFESSKV